MKIKAIRLDVLNLNNPREWDEYSNILMHLKCDHPFYQKSFLQTFSHNSDSSTLKAFVLKDSYGDALLVMPFVLRHLKNNLSDSTSYFDVISPYGYNGPFIRHAKDSSFLKEFWEGVDQWYRSHNIITEFIRFDLNNNHSNYSGTLVKSLKVVNGKLMDLDLIWNNYEHHVRKNINRAHKEDLKVRVFYQNIHEDAIDDFYSIYIQTMKRNNASNMFYFSKEKLKKYIRDCRFKVALALVYKEEKAISAEVLLLSETIIYSFLGGTNSEYFSLRPNNLLKHYVIKWAIDHEFKFYVLGGGQKIDDGIYRYKKAFFKNDIVPFYTGRKIINASVYSKFCNDHENTVDIAAGFFPKYGDRMSLQT